MTKEELLERVRTTWEALCASYAGLSEDAMLEPGAVGEWSVKDVIAHVTTWEEEALQALPVILAGGRLPRYSTKYGGVNAFNALRAAEKRDLPLAEVLAAAEETHKRLIEAIVAAPEEQIATYTRFRRRIRLDTYSHYPDHTRAIAAWRERTGR